MSKLKELREKRASVFGEIDELRKATDGKEMTADEQQRWDTLLAEYDTADKKVGQEERFEEMERRQAEQAYERQQKDEGKDDGTEYRGAFVEYLLKGENGVSAENRKLFESRAGLSGLAGGVLVPATLASSIEKALKTYGGMLEAGSVFSTSTGGDLIMPTVNDTTSKATVVAEYQKSTQKAPSFGSETMKAYTYRTPIVPVSMELLQDSSFNLESLLSELLSDSFGRGMNEDLTIGNGTGKPKGIINWATASDAAPAAAAIKLDDIIDLIKSVDSAYAKQGRFMFNRNTLWSLVKIKDTTGRYIWQEGAKDGTPPTLFAKPYTLNDDMPDIGAGNASVLFGDFSKFKIRMVKDFRIIRLNELLAEYLSIGIFGFARLDGLLLNAGTHPIKKIVHAGS
ncbi:phage major capsid protein [Alistipes sp. OttesenSCG-928-B03]|nr:phage major capsid protein [Alistipes sp. OttesenSCG-928-B03]